MSGAPGASPRHGWSRMAGVGPFVRVLATALVLVPVLAGGSRSHPAPVFAVSEAEASHLPPREVPASTPGAFAAVMDPFGTAPARHVVLISVDGLRPEFYLEDRWPAVMMRQMAREGAHAKGVRGVHPSVTYPSHTTMVTGAMPARHGIFYNSPFEEGGQTGRWYWEAEHLTTPTLWDGVREAGGTSGALWWPVTVGADIDFNLPEVWPLEPDGDRTETLRAHEHPRGLLAELEAGAVGPLDDRFRGAWLSRADRMAAMSAYILEHKQPNLLLVHFTTTDSHQHSYGREHPLVERAVQAVDRGIARIVEAAEEAGILEETAFIITGDHGFSDIHTVLAPNVWLVEAGLMEDRPDRGDWRATFHTSGGSAFLKLRDPEDEAALGEVQEILAGLPQATRRLFQFIDADRMAEIGADPSVAFSLSGVNGVAMSPARSGAAIRSGSGGTHGHFPDFRNMETGFVAWGAGIEAGARVPLMGMEDIAPVAAHLLGLRMEMPDGVLLPGLVVDPPQPPRVPVEEEAHRDHYRSFPSTDSLASYLGAGSGAGVQISAHRGGPEPGLPENALPTFEKSLGYGPMLIELDLRATSDGRVVILHDETLDRTTSGTGRVGDHAVEEVKNLRLRQEDGSLSDAWLSSLQEALEWADGRAVLRLDVKAGVTPEMVVSEIRAAEAFNRVMVIAQGMEEVAEYQRLAPELVLSFWHDPEGDGVLSLEAAQELVASEFDRSRFVVGAGSTRNGWNEAALELLRAHGIRAMVSTFGETDLAAMEEGRWEVFCPLVEAQVGVLITDAVESAARAVQEC